MSNYYTEEDKVEFSEPILAQKGVKLKVNFAEKTQWESKVGGKKSGEKFDACKITLDIDDSTVKTEHSDARPKRTFDDQFNIVQFPYEDKKTGELKKLGRNKLFQLETALGFEPIFMANGSRVEPFVSKNGNKLAPKIEGVKRIINPDFFDAYFDQKGRPKMENWSAKTIYADIEVETSEQFGSKNTVSRYVKAPLV